MTQNLVQIHVLSLNTWCWNLWVLAWGWGAERTGAPWLLGGEAWKPVCTTFVLLSCSPWPFCYWWSESWEGLLLSSALGLFIEQTCHCRNLAVRKSGRGLGWGMTCAEGGVTVRLRETRAAVKEWPGGGMGHLWPLWCPALPDNLISGCCCWHRAEAAEQRKLRGVLEGTEICWKHISICMMRCKQDGFWHEKPSVETSNH